MLINSNMLTNSKTKTRLNRDRKFIAWSRFACGALLFAAIACEPGGHHHQEGAHVHGVARLSLAIDGEKQLGVVLRAPAQSVYGFEHAARSDADRAAQTRALDRLRNDFAALIGLDAGAGCRAASAEVEVHEDGHADHEHQEHGEDHAEDHDAADQNKVSGEHREVHVEYIFECETPVAGSELRPTLHQAFQGIETIQIQILGDDRQKSSVITRAGAADARIAL
ncbi:MAG: DUF2796 domain-containing protein [Leptospirales bacterium]|jgi:hypothetical protein